MSQYIWCDICATEYLSSKEHICKKLEMIAAITDGPIISENITIDQHYRFTKQIQEQQETIAGLTKLLSSAKDVMEMHLGLTGIPYTEVEHDMFKWIKALDKIREGEK